MGCIICKGMGRTCSVCEADEVVRLESTIRTLRARIERLEGALKAAMYAIKHCHGYLDDDARALIDEALGDDQ